MRAQALFACHTQLRIAESTKKHTAVSPAPFSLASSTACRSTVRCRAVSCPACGVVHAELARPSMSSSILYSKYCRVDFPFHFTFFVVFLMLDSTGHLIRNRNPGSAWISYFPFRKPLSYFWRAEIMLILFRYWCSLILVLILYR